MLATTTTLIETRNAQARCGACRYFLHDRCANATARVEGEDRKVGECPYFRFSHSGGLTGTGY